MNLFKQYPTDVQANFQTPRRSTSMFDFGRVSVASLVSQEDSTQESSTQLAELFVAVWDIGGHGDNNLRHYFSESNAILIFYDLTKTAEANQVRGYLDAAFDYAGMQKNAADVPVIYLVGTHSDKYTTVDLAIPSFVALADEYHVKPFLVSLRTGRGINNLNKVLYDQFKPSELSLDLAAVSTFKTIYTAIRSGQTGNLFNPNLLENKEVADETDEQLLARIKSQLLSYPDSRTAEAWMLAKAHAGKCASSNLFLFKRVHSISVSRSGIFSRTEVQSDEDFTTVPAPNSRRERIKEVLDGSVKLR